MLSADCKSSVCFASLIVGFNGVLTPIFSENVVVSLCHYISRVHSNFSQKRSVFN